jgi:hypothetical protein
MFNPRPTIQLLPITATDTCVVVDDFLLDPQAMVDFALRERTRFVDASTFYPGPELKLPELAGALEHFVTLHVRRALGARRTLAANCRLSIATRAPEQLKPLQRICHCDVGALPPGEGAAAMVAYLFRDERLGGTSFYVPRGSREEANAVVAEAARMDNRTFTGLIATPPGYMTASNRFFEKVLEAPARWNRAVFYSADVFHSGDIQAPQLLDADPACGRLTMNGFFRTRRSAA